MHLKYLTYLNHWFYENSRKPVILRGARQVGKSTLVRQFAQINGLKLYEINLEKYPLLNATFQTLDVKKILNRISAILEKDIDVSEKSLLFLDEIQATPDGLGALRYFYEECPELGVVAAGSLLEFTLNQHEFSMPVGRIEYLYMHPLSFSEFLHAHGEKWLAQWIESWNMKVEVTAEVHEKFLDFYRLYLKIGGMPEAVAASAKKSGEKKIQKILQNITTNYLEDFAKYAKKTDVAVLQKTYEKIPLHIGEKMIFSHLSRDEPAAKLRKAVDLLHQARVIRLAYHTSASGIPLSAQKNEDVFKTYWIDVGLYQRALKMPLNSLAMRSIEEGAVAEQFIAQHLQRLGEPSEEEALYYWRREGATTNAEVDFVFQMGAAVIPIEVKSGISGSLKSMHQFAFEKKSPLAVRFSVNTPSLLEVKLRIPVGMDHKPVKYMLLSLPFYLIEKLEDALKVF